MGDLAAVIIYCDHCAKHAPPELVRTKKEARREVRRKFKWRGLGRRDFCSKCAPRFRGMTEEQADRHMAMLRVTRKK